jgi:hypothetical protein
MRAVGLRGERAADAFCGAGRAFRCNFDKNFVLSLLANSETLTLARGACYTFVRIYELPLPRR